MQERELQDAPATKAVARRRAKDKIDTHLGPSTRSLKHHCHEATLCAPRHSHRNLVCIGSQPQRWLYTNSTYSFFLLLRQMNHQSARAAPCQIPACANPGSSRTLANAIHQMTLRVQPLSCRSLACARLKSWVLCRPASWTCKVCSLSLSLARTELGVKPSNSFVPGGCL